MLQFFKKKKVTGQKLELKIHGMHCVSCAMNIDDSLEELDGVLSAETSYAKGKTVVTFDDTKVTEEQIKKVIQTLEYQVFEE